MFQRNFVFVFLLINLIRNVFSAELFYFDTTESKNPDFDMDSVPDGTFTSYNYHYLNHGPMVLVWDMHLVILLHMMIMVHNETTFNQWTLDYDPEVTSVGHSYLPYDHGFFSHQFFPVDNLGFGNEGLEHNYKWCVRIEFFSVFPSNPDHFSFEARFYHSDDMFVYVNGKLIYSFLGIETLSEFGFDFMEIYEPSEPFHTIIFNCNRKYRKDIHYLGVVSEFPLECDWIDECGVCNGDGSTCRCDPRHNCINEEYYCIARECVDEFTCNDIEFNCTEEYPGNLCIAQSCEVFHGCVSTDISCDDFDPCTFDECEPSFGCINTLIPNCIPCDNSACITTDLCQPLECDPLLDGICVSKPINCTHINPCILGECDPVDGQCTYVEIVGCTSSSESSSDDGGLGSVGTGGITTTPPGFETTIASTIASTVGSTIASTIASTVSTTISSTISEAPITTTSITDISTIASTVGSTIASTVGSTIASTISSTTSTVSHTTGIPIVPITTETTTLSSTVSSTLSSTLATTLSSTLATTLSSTLGTTLSSTLSSTLSAGSTISSLPHDPCLFSNCRKGERCYNLENKAICVKTNCLSCEDLNCQSQGLRCISFKLDKHPKDMCDDCCKYTATCSH
ncbi:hypothetical protein ACTA71_010656 [Dictyostelium dimigraforme]